MSLSIDDLSTFVRETVNASVADLSTRLIDISTYVHTNVDASISRIDSSNVAQDASIIDHQSRIVSLEGATYVRTVTGESGIAQRPNDEYVAVSATTDSETGTVTLNASVQLAEAVTLSTGHTAATVTGLATDGMVKDYVEESLMWEVITD